MLTHGLTKEAQVPDREILLALRRNVFFEQAPEWVVSAHDRALEGYRARVMSPGVQCVENC